MKTILIINTSDSKKVLVAIELNGKRVEKASEIGVKKSQTVLPMIDVLLKENDLELKDISEIKVEIGPGSFTGLRVGIAIANMLGTLLNIPVNGQKAGNIVSPIYEGSKYDE